jgi:hypothetical protein
LGQEVLTVIRYGQLGNALMMRPVLFIFTSMIFFMTVSGALTIAWNASGRFSASARHAKVDLFFKHPI